MANSNTKHSKQLRAKTSAEWDKKNIIRKTVRFNINNPVHMENLKILEDINKDSSNQQFHELFERYKKAIQK